MAPKTKTPPAKTTRTMLFEQIMAAWPDNMRDEKTESEVEDRAAPEHLRLNGLVQVDCYSDQAVMVEWEGLKGPPARLWALASGEAAPMKLAQFLSKLEAHYCKNRAEVEAEEKRQAKQKARDDANRALFEEWRDGMLAGQEAPSILIHQRDGGCFSRRDETPCATADATFPNGCVAYIHFHTGEATLNDNREYKFKSPAAIMNVLEALAENIGK